MSTALRIVDGRSGDLNAAVATRIREKMAGRRISKTEAAKELHVSSMYIGRRVNGEVDLSISDIECFSALLGVSVEYLICGIEKAPPAGEPMGQSNPEDGGPNDGPPAGIEPATFSLRVRHLAPVFELFPAGVAA